MILTAIDPGTKRSAFCQLTDDGAIWQAGIVPNNEMLDVVGDWATDPCCHTLVIEQIASMGMAVGEEVFTTVHWVGRFHERWLARGGSEPQYIKRIAVKMHVCGHPRAKDPNIRQALIDRYGGAGAIGTKKSPGPLYGFSKDKWAALAVGVTYLDTQKLMAMEVGR